MTTKEIKPKTMVPRTANPNLNFGARTDHFGYASTNLILQESSKEPIPNERADANDEFEDIVAFEHYGNRAGTLYQATVKYALKSGTLNLNTLKIGEKETGVIIDSIDVDTTNNDWPMITVSGRLGALAVQEVPGYTMYASLPSITINGVKMAQSMDFTYDAGCRLNSCSLKASTNTAQLNDGLGEPVAYAVGMGTIELTADFVRVTAAPAWTLGADWSERKSPGITEPQAGFHTSTGEAERIALRG